MADRFDIVAGSELEDLASRIGGGGLLEPADCFRLWMTHDLTALGALANRARERAAGERATFRGALHVNTTGRPLPDCALCAAAAGAGAGPLGVEELERRLGPVAADAAGELHLTGGTPPGADLPDVAALIGRARSLRPALRARALTWGELERLGEVGGSAPERVLETLAGAGLRRLAGGLLLEPSRGAPAAALERRAPWLDAALRLDLRAELVWAFPRSAPEEAAAELGALREASRRWPIFDCFTPIPDPAPEGMTIPPATGYNLLRAIAVGRLVLGTIPHLRATWTTLAESLLQVAQWYGADDAGCFLLGEADAGTPGPERLRALLGETGREPVESLD